jgi:hypothetical protein
MICVLGGAVPWDRETRGPHSAVAPLRSVGGNLRTYLMAAVLSLAATAAAWGFDFARYQEADLDDILAEPRPETGFDVIPGTPYRLTVDLTSYAAACDARFLKMAMMAVGIRKDKIDALQISSCIIVRSATGKMLPLFIQGKVAEFLPKEIPLGSKVMFYVIHTYTAASGPGLLVNEFITRATFDGKDGSCGCGGAEAHPGADYKAPEGTPVPAMDAGVVVKIEADENALVDAPHTAWCGRYIVVRHDYPNGRTAFSRYAGLGPRVGGAGEPLTVGTHVAKGDKLGEVGGGGNLHFEIRPVEPAGMNTSPLWQRRYGADPAMAWSKHQPVDPVKFDDDAFAGRTKTK